MQYFIILAMNLTKVVKSLKNRRIQQILQGIRQSFTNRLFLKTPLRVHFWTQVVPPTVPEQWEGMHFQSLSETNQQKSEKQLMQILENFRENVGFFEDFTTVDLQLHYQNQKFYKTPVHSCSRSLETIITVLLKRQ